MLSAKEVKEIAFSTVGRRRFARHGYVSSMDGLGDTFNVFVWARGPLSRDAAEELAQKIVMEGSVNVALQYGDSEDDTLYVRQYVSQSGKNGFIVAYDGIGSVYDQYTLEPDKNEGPYDKPFKVLVSILTKDSSVSPDFDAKIERMDEKVLPMVRKCDIIALSKGTLADFCYTDEDGLVSLGAYDLGGTYVSLQVDQSGCEEAATALEEALGALAIEKLYNDELCEDTVQIAFLGVVPGFVTAVFSKHNGENRVSIFRPKHAGCQEQFGTYTLEPDAIAEGAAKYIVQATKMM